MPETDLDPTYIVGDDAPGEDDPTTTDQRTGTPPVERPEGAIGDRLRHEPSNLDDDIPDDDDLIYPAAINVPLGRAPGM